MKRCICTAITSVLLVIVCTGITNAHTLSKDAINAEINKYNQPVVVMRSTKPRVAGKLDFHAVKENPTETVSGECMGDYVAVVPGQSQLDANNVTSSTYYSPTKIGKNWLIFDHIGVMDSAFSGKRHVVRRDTGIQWFGYDAPPYNDFMLRDFGSDMNSNFSINVKQAPVRADWHTINGSGMIYGAVVTGGNTYEAFKSGGDIVLPAVQTEFSQSKSESDTSQNILNIDGLKFSGYTFVATNNYNEVRYYDNVSLKDYASGTAKYTCIAQEKKKCNSQSLTVKWNGSEFSFMIGSKPWKVNGDELVLQVGGSVPSALEVDPSAQNGTQTTFTVKPPKGTIAGATVDYATHACESLSSVYMFNYTVNGQEYF